MASPRGGVEVSHSGLVRPPAKRVEGNPLSRVQIPLPPPPDAKQGSEPHVARATSNSDPCQSPFHVFGGLAGRPSKLRPAQTGGARRSSYARRRSGVYPCARIGGSRRRARPYTNYCDDDEGGVASWRARSGVRRVSGKLGARVSGWRAAGRTGRRPDRPTPRS